MNATVRTETPLPCRADNVIRHAYIERDRRDQLNRRHVQSIHMTGYPLPLAKAPAAPDLNIGPLYAAAVIALVGLVGCVNFIYS